jgi:uncharacterized protein with PQ loop repeat
MTENRDEKITQIFARAESALIDEDFRARVMLKVARKRRFRTVSHYGSWALVLLCSLFIIPMALKLFFTVGTAISDLPVLLANSAQTYLDFPIILLVISGVIGYLLTRFQLLRLPSFHLFGRIGIFRLYTQ